VRSGLWGATDAAPAIAVSFRVPPRSDESLLILANLQLILLGYPTVGGRVEFHRIGSTSLPVTCRTAFSGFDFLRSHVSLVSIGEHKSRQPAPPVLKAPVGQAQRPSAASPPCNPGAGPLPEIAACGSPSTRRSPKGPGASNRAQTLSPRRRFRPAAVQNVRRLNKQHWLAIIAKYILAVS
jgi:hypothetical protein